VSYLVDSSSLKGTCYCKDVRGRYQYLLQQGVPFSVKLYAVYSNNNTTSHVKSYVQTDRASFDRPSETSFASSGVPVHCTPWDSRAYCTCFQNSLPPLLKLHRCLAQPTAHASACHMVPTLWLRRSHASSTRELVRVWTHIYLHVGRRL
jgi:hypothetical protein